jgi:GntR family transcriptional regulator/MocR family aminotransferase
MHLLTWLPVDMDEENVINSAAAAGIRLDGLRPYRLAPGGPGGLVFGYAAINESAIPAAVSALADAIG